METMKRVKELVQFGGFLDIRYLRRTLAKEFQQMESCFASSPKSAIPEDSFSNIRNCIGITRGFMHDLSSVKREMPHWKLSCYPFLMATTESQIVLLLNESTTSSESSSNGCMMIVQASDLPFVSISRSTGLNRWNLHELKMENEKVWNIPHFVVAPLAVSDARTTTIEGLSLNLEDMPAKSASGAQSQNKDSVAEHAMFNEGNSLKRRRRGLFSFLRVILAFTESFSKSDDDDFKTDACSQMHTSRLLQLNNCESMVWVKPGSVVHVLHSWRGGRVGKRHRKAWRLDLLKNGYCRLKYICNKEGLKASSIALTALAEYTGE
ncbi:unnamed protein product [Camellia sinensis]